MFNTVGRIFQLRDNRNMSTNKFSEFTGVSQSYLSELEKGKKGNVTIDIIEKVCNACEISLTDFFNNIDNPANIKVSMVSKQREDLLERIEKLKSEIDDIEKRIK